MLSAWSASLCVGSYLSGFIFFTTRLALLCSHYTKTSKNFHYPIFIDRKKQICLTSLVRHPFKEVCMDPLDFIREHVKSHIEMPPMPPCTGGDDSCSVQLRGPGIWLLITQYLNDGTVVLDIDPSDDGKGDLGALSLMCSQGKDGLVWNVMVDHSLPGHFHCFRDYFGDRDRAYNLPHAEGVRWLDQLVEDFLSYTPG